MYGKGNWIIVEGIPVDIFPADVLEREAIGDAEETEYEGVPDRRSFGQSI